MPDPRPAHGGYPDTTPAPTDDDDVYLTAARAMIEADGDNYTRLFEWRNCATCPGTACACSGVPYPSAPVRAAVDAARAPLAAELAEARRRETDFRATLAADGFVAMRVEELDRLRAERDEARRQLAAATAATEGGEWVTDYGHTFTGPFGQTVDWHPGLHCERDTHRRRVWYGPATPVDGGTP